MKLYLSILTGSIILLNTQTAVANDCQLDITGNDAMQFNTAELTVPSSCKQVTLNLKHIGKLPINVMGHNWVLTKSSDLQSVASDGLSAGLDNQYLVKDDARILASTNVIGGGQETSITFSTKDLIVGQDYAYFCSFPGHWAIMKGVFKVLK